MSTHEGTKGTVVLTVLSQKTPANQPMRDNRVTSAKAARVSTSARGGEAESAGSETSGAAARVPRQALAPLKHGGKGTVALAPTVRGVKRELCKRLGVRYQDLTAAGREAVDLYARARAKLAAIDDWLTRNPMLDESGAPAPCLALYSTLLNTPRGFLTDGTYLIVPPPTADTWSLESCAKLTTSRLAGRIRCDALCAHSAGCAPCGAPIWQPHSAHARCGRASRSSQRFARESSGRGGHIAGPGGSFARKGSGGTWSPRNYGRQSGGDSLGGARDGAGGAQGGARL
jgi:hypothetical protein